MERKAALGIVLTLILSMSMLAFNGVTAQSVITIGIGVYWDSSLMNQVSSMNWGILQPGFIEDAVVYIRNEGNVPVTLSMISSNWNPPAASSYMTLNWNYTGGVLEPSSVVPVKLSLFVISSIAGIYAFSFDCVLSATGSLTASVLIATYGSITRTWTVDDDGPADFHTIQEAINAANPEDTVYVCDGTYYEGLTISKSLKLTGQSQSNTIIDGSTSANTVVFIDSNNVTVSGFTIKGGMLSGGYLIGIIIWSSKGCNISGNIIIDNTDDGIYFPMSSGNIFSHNIIVNNGGDGMYTGFYSSDNIIICNTIMNNGEYGIGLDYSSDNIITHNNFINNTIQAHNNWASINIWNDGYPSGGNYWSDYVTRYPDAQELDDSGIWDTPYVIDENNRDNYPLIEPWTPTPPTIMAGVDIDPDTLNLRSKGKWITAYIQLPADHNPADIDATTIMLNGTIAPILDPKFGFVTDSSEYLLDHNNDGILERMVKFDRASVESFITSQGIGYGNVALTMTGKLFDGTQFEGTDIIFVVDGGAGGRRK